MIILYNSVQKADPSAGALARIMRFLNTWEPQAKKFLVGGHTENEVSYKDIQLSLLSGKVPASLFQQWQQQYASFVVDILSPLWESAYQTAAQQVASSRPGFVFDPFVPAVQQWSDKRAAALITQCTGETKKGIQAALKQSVYHEDIGVDELAKVIRPMIGLTRPQVVANQNYYNTLLDNGVKPQLAAQRSVSYASRQHRYRAQMIARTESATAYNQAEYEVVRQAQKSGYMGKTVKVWCTAGDERTCATCGALNGKRIEFGDDYTAAGGNVRVPPAHPQCRCTLLYVEKGYEPEDKFKDMLIQGDSPLSGLSKDAVMSVSKEIGNALNKYPSLKGYITNLGVCQKGLMATCPEDDLSSVMLKFNKDLFTDTEIVKEAVERDVQLGGSPENVTWQTAGVHEIGHVALAKIIHGRYTTVEEVQKDWNEDITAKLIVKRAMKDIHAKFFWAEAQTISQYAAVSASEAIGESILDCYVNRKEAQQLSKAIEKELMKCL